MITGVYIDRATERVAVELDDGDGGLVVIDPRVDGEDVPGLDSTWEKLT